MASVSKTLSALHRGEGWDALHSPALPCPALSCPALPCWLYSGIPLQPSPLPPFPVFAHLLLLASCIAQQLLLLGTNIQSCHLYSELYHIGLSTAMLHVAAGRNFLLNKQSFITTRDKPLILHSCVPADLLSFNSNLRLETLHEPQCMKASE